MTISTDKWYLGDTYNIKFITKEIGFTACGKDIKVVAGTVFVQIDEYWRKILI